MRARFLPALAITLAATISAAPVLAQNGPSQNGPPLRVPDGIETIRDVAYAGTDNPNQRLDLYLPKAPPDSKPLPLIVFIHGGGFAFGDKATAGGSGGPSGMNLVLSMVARGQYAAASLDYRLSGEAIWPAQIHDCKAAIRWLRGNAAKYHLDADKIGAIGTSAGGHLVAMLGTSGSVAGLEGTLGAYRNVSSRVSCVVDEFGPTDLLALYGGNSQSPDTPEAKLIGGAPATHQEAARSASPISHVSQGTPPFLLIHGTKDPAVNFNQSERFQATLKAAGVDTTFIQIVGGGHGGFPMPELAQRIRQFFDKHLRGQSATISDEPIQMTEVRQPSR